MNAIVFIILFPVIYLSEFSSQGVVEHELQFANVDIESKVEHVAVFYNDKIYAANINITYLSCNCTTVTLSRTVLPPDSYTTMTITIDAHAKQEPFQAGITIRLKPDELDLNYILKSNGPTSGNISAYPSVLDLGNMQTGDGKTVMLKLTGLDKTYRDFEMKSSSNDVQYVESTYKDIENALYVNINITPTSNGAFSHNICFENDDNMMPSPCVIVKGKVTNNRAKTSSVYINYEKMSCEVKFDKSLKPSSSTSHIKIYQNKIIGDNIYYTISIDAFHFNSIRFGKLGHINVYDNNLTLTKTLNIYK